MVNLVAPFCSNSPMHAFKLLSKRVSTPVFLLVGFAFPLGVLLLCLVLVSPLDRHEWRLDSCKKMCFCPASERCQDRQLFDLGTAGLVHTPSSAHFFGPESTAHVGSDAPSEKGGTPPPAMREAMSLLTGDPAFRGFLLVFVFSWKFLTPIQLKLCKTQTGRRYHAL